MRRAGALLVVIVACACGGTGGSSGDTVPEPASPLDGSWQAVGATVDGEVVTDLDGVAVTMDLGGGRIAGSSGCNSYETAVDVAGDTITFGPRTATEAFCSGPPGEVEGLFSAATTGSATWVIEGDVLTITNGTAVWVFERIDGEPLAPAATTAPPVTSAPAASGGTVEIRPVGGCFPQDGEGPAPDASAGQAVLPDPAAGARCIVGPAVGPGPVLGPPAIVSIEPSSQTWMVSPSLLPEARSAWDELTAACFQRIEPCSSGQIAVVLDGVIVSAPTVVQPALPEFQLSGFTEAQATVLADAIDAGQPVPAAGSGGGMDGPVMFAGPDRAVTVVEETLDGTLFLGDNCLVLTRDDQTTFVLVIWPSGTSWLPDGSGVVLPSGEVLGLGPTVELEGAVIDDAELADYTDSAAVRDEIERCRRDDTTQLFVAA